MVFIEGILGGGWVVEDLFDGIAEGLVVDEAFGSAILIE